MVSVTILNPTESVQSHIRACMVWECANWEITVLGDILKLFEWFLETLVLVLGNKNLFEIFFLIYKSIQSNLNCFNLTTILFYKQF